MKTQRNRFIILGILVIFAIPTWIGYSVVKYFSPTETIIPYTNDECFASFEDFAYAVPDVASNQTKDFSLSQWKLVAEVPGITIDTNIWSSVSATRQVNGDTEVWVQRNPSASLYMEEESRKYKFHVFQVNKQEWKTVPAEIGDSHLFIDTLFVRSDGTLWGRNIWSFVSEMSNQPVLSRYNDETERFEVVGATRAIPNGTKDADPYTADLPQWAKTFLDSQGVFWFVVEKDAIYSFDVTNQIVKRHADLSNIYVDDAYQSTDGKIYIWRYPNDPTYSMPSFKLGKGEILRFDPETSLMETIASPEMYWPKAGNLWVDTSDRLWMGAIGWRDPDGTWHEIYPRPFLYFANMNTGNFRWGSPAKIVFESSDGRLWFRRIIDEDADWGMAWLDPQTMQGCWFTSEYTDIEEDQDHNLWMVVNRKLYKSQLPSTPTSTEVSP
ncbi:MAG: hypothetical protein HY869_14620 [Chloroflexi bacterium]|nr:hypothetical protein [Chloroflexota bacterium]